MTTFLKEHLPHTQLEGFEDENLEKITEIGSLGDLAVYRWSDDTNSLIVLHKQDVFKQGLTIGIMTEEKARDLGEELIHATGDSNGKEKH